MLQYLFSPTKQFTYDSGKLLDAGQIYVYIQDTTDLATLYDDNGDLTNNPIILDVNGRASVKADDIYEYRLEVYDCFGVLQFTCTAFYGGEGGGGTFIVRHDDTLSGNGTSQSLLGVVNIPLAVDETMTAYEDEVSGENALILGVNGDWFGETFSSYYNNKVDWDSFNELSGKVNDKADTSALNNYYTKDETNNLFQPQSAMGDYYLKTQTSSDVELANAFANIPTGGGFPIVSGSYTADCNGSAYKVSTTTSTVILSDSGVIYASYPSTNIDADWSQIINKANEIQYIPTVSSYTFIVNSDVDIQYSAVDMLNEITFIAASWGAYLNYSANFKDGNTNKGTLVIPSGKVMTATKNWNWEDNGFRWNKKLQDGTLMNI